MSTFSGFSEEELKRIKSGETGPNSGQELYYDPGIVIKKLDKIGFKSKKVSNQYKMQLQKQSSDEVIDSIDFDKCKLSLRSPTTPSKDLVIDNNKENVDSNDNVTTKETNETINNNKDFENGTVENMQPKTDKEESIDFTADIMRSNDNYSEDELVNHKAKLEELQLRQKIMEEQNKKRKEMLAKALADRTKQTAEEVMRLEKIKKELQVLDSQFSQDVSVLRGKIDQACLTYADAEKHYLKVEKEFLQAKIQLQKEKEKKELLTEHLCALITHNETRKAQKLETLMLELATDKKSETNAVEEIDEKPVVVDGVDERTGKMVELTPK